MKDCRPILLEIHPNSKNYHPRTRKIFQTSQTRPDLCACERLDLLATAVDPPPLDLSIRVIAELRPVLGAVCPLVRVPLRGDRLALELRRHRRTHRRVARTLFGPIGQVEDRLVQTGRLLRRRRTRQPGANDQRGLIADGQAKHVPEVLVCLEEKGDLFYVRDT